MTRHNEQIKQQAQKTIVIVRLAAGDSLASEERVEAAMAGSSNSLPDRASRQLDTLALTRRHRLVEKSDSRFHDAHIETRTIEIPREKQCLLVQLPAPARDGSRCPSQCICLSLAGSEDPCFVM